MPERHYDIAELVTAANSVLTLLEIAASGNSNDAEIDAGRDCASVLRQLVAAVTADRPNVLYTRDQVSAAANNAANLITDTFGFESSETIRIHSYIDLTVNGTLALLDDPDLDLDGIMNACWQVDEQSCAICGLPVHLGDDETYLHDGDSEPDDDDAHIPIPYPADAAEMVREWISL